MRFRRRNIINRATGASWEDVFERQARSKGLLPIKVGLSAQIVGPGKVIARKSFLDFQLIRSDGRIAMVDSKSYTESFNFSEIRSHQLKKATIYEQWGIPAGFVVWFRKTHEVVYFSGSLLAKIGPGHSFRPDQGLALGRLSDFDLNLIFSDPGGL